MIRIYHEIPNDASPFHARNMLCAVCENLCTLISYEMAGKKLVSTGTLLVIDEEGLGQEGSGVVAGVVGNGRAGIATATDLEDGLQLSAVRMRVTSSKHLDYQAAERPDIGFAGVGRLSNDFWCHPED